MQIKRPKAEMALRLTLDELESRLAEADAAYADAQWREHLGRAGQDELAQLEAARSSLLLDDGVRERIRRWEGRPSDPNLTRRVQLVSRRLHWAEIESRPEVYVLRNRVDRAIVSFDSRWLSRAGRAEILRCHPDRAHRRDAWLALGPLADQIEADVRELMRRRQRLARELGYDGYVSWALEVSGLNRQWVEALFDELRHLTEAPYRAWLSQAAQRLSLRDGLRPWDLAFAAAGEAALPDEAFPCDGLLQAVQEVAEGLGLGPEAAGLRVDVVDIPYAALCYAVRPPDDVRILLSPRDGHVYYSILFHEFGHALHWRGLRSRSLASRWQSPPFNEAMACIWERLASEPDWLMGRDGITPDQVMAYRRLWAGRVIYRLRALIAQAIFEYRAYQDVDGDLLALLQDTFAEYLGVPHDRAAGWADSPFWTSHPVYQQNYVVAEVVASQTLAALRRRFGRLIGESRVGAWLVERFYAPDALRPWLERVVRATGAPLSSFELAADLGVRGKRPPAGICTLSLVNRVSGVEREEDTYDHQR
jgi:peptidyl-dipeptidase A